MKEGGGKLSKWIVTIMKLVRGIEVPRFIAVLFCLFNSRRIPLEEGGINDHKNTQTIPILLDLLSLIKIIHMNKTKPDYSYYRNIAPTKLTEGRRIKLNTEGWGILTEYFLESVKINNTKSGTSSSATIRVGDRAGTVTCVIRGTSVGLLFGLTITEWMQVQELCGQRQQLFYRYFKNGICKDFCYEQRLFYNFCMTNQKNDVLVARFRRCVNRRSKDNHEALLEVLDLRKCDHVLLDIYIEQLRLQSDKHQ